ncbi:MAG: hypothetical protein WBN94_00090 [Methanothrix sp.]
MDRLILSSSAPSLHDFRPDRAPARPDDIAASPEGPATGGGHKQQPGPERRKSAALRLPGAA